MPESKTSNGKSSKGASPAESLKKYYELMQSNDLQELEVKDGDFYVRLARRKPAAAVLPAQLLATIPAGQAGAGAPDVPAEQNQFHSIASPLSGIFYRSPSPNSDAFVKEGDKVALGAVLCIVEAMKVMNEIRADRPSVIRKILIENGKPVTAAQNLFLVDPV